MEDPQRNPVWDSLFGGSSVTGSMLLVVYPLIFALVGGTLFHLLG